MDALALALASLILLLSLRLTEANPNLAHTQQNRAVSRDLQQLTLSYQRCHIHVVLFNGKVYIHGIHSPYTLSRIQVNCSINQPEVGRLAYPQMRYMVDHCQATFQVLPSKRQLDKLEENYRFYAYETRDHYKMRPDEGYLAWYMLKQRHSFLLVHHDTSFRDRTDLTEGGGNVFMVLKYQMRTHASMGACSILESVTAVCEHCLRIEITRMCSALSQCLHLADQAYNELTDDGRNAQWVFVRSSAKQQDLEKGRRNPGSYYCIRPHHSKHGRCTQSLQDALLNYITGSLNESVTGIAMPGPDRPNAPMRLPGPKTLFCLKLLRRPGFSR